MKESRASTAESPFFHCPCRATSSKCALTSSEPLCFQLSCLSSGPQVRASLQAPGRLWHLLSCEGPFSQLGLAADIHQILHYSVTLRHSIGYSSIKIHYSAMSQPYQGGPRLPLCFDTALKKAFFSNLVSAGSYVSLHGILLCYKQATQAGCQ